jgi:myo-inositol-1(or 4)-monophosphatase
MDLKNICKQVVKLSGKVGKFIREEKNRISSKDIEIKGVHNYVTYVDKESEKRLVAELSKIFPEAGFIVEEETIDKKGFRYNWVIDPLDGTTNFIHSIPVFAISIALMDNEEIIVGVVYDIMQDECFYAWEGGGAWLNDRPIKVSKARKLDNSLIATGFPYTGFDKMNDYLLMIKDILDRSHGIRRLGSAAIDLVYVACGRLEGFYEYGLNPWDVAAGALIVSEAGGQVTDFDGGEQFIHGRRIIATNRNIYPELFHIIQKYFG